jgi:hypothetical protein
MDQMREVKKTTAEEIRNLTVLLTEARAKSKKYTSDLLKT